MSDTIFDLANLPAPKVVEPLSFETIFSAKLLKLLELDPTFNALIESDPAIKQLEIAAYDELILRQRINDAARARLLAYATGEDLDQLAAFYGVTRVPGELDTPFKNRVRQAILSKSAAGTEAQYRFAALSASIDVADAAVDSPRGGEVRVSVLSRLGDGTPSSGLLQAVETVVQSRNVRALNDTVSVIGAEILPFDVSASIYLTPTAPQAVFDGLPNLLRDEYLRVRAMGYNVAGSWLISKLQTGGVQRVAGIDSSWQLKVEPYQFASLRNINLTLAGRDY